MTRSWGRLYGTMGAQHELADHAVAFELKGRMATLTIMCLRTDDPQAIAAELAAKVREAPSMFEGLPVVLDVGAFAESAPGRLAAWVETLRSYGLAPVGVSSGDARVSDGARALGLASFPGLGGVASERPSVRPEPQDPARPATPGRIVEQPVRSGQQVYARGGDLVVLASVSPGAELMADGNIHVYGTLRGRALAGVQGNERARILCRSLRAELVSISGWYRVSEEISETEGPVQVYLEGESVRIAAL